MPSAHINSKLPPEILTKIFLKCVMTVERKDIHRSRSDLCLVCRHWRQLVESHAQLWSTIYIRCWCKGEMVWPPASTVGLSLKRSVGAPLEIYIVEGGWFDDLTHDFVDQATLDRETKELLRRQAVLDRHTREVFALLAAQAFRWQRLALDLNNALVDGVQCTAFAEAEQLQDVVIMGGGGVAVISALASVPNLRSFKWTMAPGIILHYIVNTFPLELLANFHLKLNYSMFLSELLRIMQKCTSAVEMRIGMECCLYTTQGPLPLVTLPNLRTLELSLKESTYDMLKYLDFPNLEILVLHWCRKYNNGWDDTIPISHYLSNSRHRIQVLLVDYVLPITKLVTFLSDSAVFRIPIVQIYTESLPSAIREDILEAVETRLPATRRAEFFVIPWFQGWGGCTACADAYREPPTVIGWTNASAYKKFEDYLTGSDKYDILGSIVPPGTFPSTAHSLVPERKVLLLPRTK